MLLAQTRLAASHVLATQATLTILLHTVLSPVLVSRATFRDGLGGLCAKEAKESQPNVATLSALISARKQGYQTQKTSEILA